MGRMIEEDFDEGLIYCIERIEEMIVAEVRWTDKWFVVSRLVLLGAT